MKLCILFQQLYRRKLALSILALSAWDEGARSLAGVNLARTVNLGVQCQLLTVLSDPTWETTDCEQCGEELGWEAHCAVDQTGVEVYVRVELAGYEVIIRQSNLFQLHCQIQQFIATEVLEYLVCGLLDDGCAWVVVLVHAVAEAHQANALFFVLHAVHELGCVTVVVVLDVFQHLKNSGVSAAVQRTRQSVDAAGNGDEHVGLCGTNQTNGRCGAVLLVVSMQDKQLVQSLRNHRVYLVWLGWVTEHHAQEVLTCVERVVWIHVWLALGRTECVRSQHWNLRQQTNSCLI